MKKTILSLFGLVAALSIAGCSAVDSNTSSNSGYDYTPFAIYLDASTLSLYVGEKHSFAPNIYPSFAHATSLEWTSSNPKVASVNSKGVVTAKSQGRAFVTCSSVKDPTVKYECAINVYTKARNNAEEDAKKILEYQTVNGLHDPDKVHVQMITTYAHKKNGEFIRKDTNYVDIYSSISDGFFSYEVTNETLRVQDGQLNYETFGYILFTNSDYSTHVYKYSDNSRTRYDRLKTQDYIGRESRYEVIMLLMDGFFNSGRKLASNYTSDTGLNLEKLPGSEDYRTPSDYGLQKEKDESGKTVISGIVQHRHDSGNFGKVAADEERDLEIPAETKLTGTQDTTYAWVQGICRSFIYDLDLKYKIDGDNYDYIQNIYENFYIDDEVTITYPDKESFQEVYSMMDL